MATGAHVERRSGAQRTRLSGDGALAPSSVSSGWFAAGPTQTDKTMNNENPDNHEGTPAQGQPDGEPHTGGRDSVRNRASQPGPFAVGEAQSGASTETSERWREGLEAIVCPYCETEMEDSEDWGCPDMNWSEVGQCPHCEKEFGWSRDINPRYSVCKLVGVATDAPTTEPRSQGDSPAANDQSSATAEGGAPPARQAERQRPEAGGVTPGAVRCSAWLGVAALLVAVAVVVWLLLGKAVMK